MLLIDLKCPYCGCKKLNEHRTYQTSNNGSRTLYQCNSCREIFSETRGTCMEGLTKPISLVIQVLKSRSEGIGFNAVCRVFNISKNTLLNWEMRFSELKETLLLYALMHKFISLVIEGDEFYTKVGENLPVEDCEGWTIVLMERASRFIFGLKAGKKERTLFFWAARMVRDLLARSGDVTLLTDGERRYGNTLFEICSEVIRSGERGRPPKALRKGLKVRLKNKGSQKNRNGHKREKYETPHREHPETKQNISDTEIHANHAEAFNSSIRRRNSTCRRRTNTYAKTLPALQRTLDIFWVVHNFIRVHFTTKQVPAVSLGILDKGLSWHEVLMIQRVVYE